MVAQSPDGVLPHPCVCVRLPEFVHGQVAVYICTLCLQRHFFIFQMSSRMSCSQTFLQTLLWAKKNRFEHEPVKPHLHVCSDFCMQICVIKNIHVYPHRSIYISLSFSLSLFPSSYIYIYRGTKMYTKCSNLDQAV